MQKRAPPEGGVLKISLSLSQDQILVHAGGVSQSSGDSFHSCGVPCIHVVGQQQIGDHLVTVALFVYAGAEHNVVTVGSFHDTGIAHSTLGIDSPVQETFHVVGTGVDTGVQTGTAYKNRHSFFVDEIEGVKILRKYGNDNVLVIKQLTQIVNGEEVLAWRMLGVPATELSNDGVYPVMLLTEHEHAYDEIAHTPRTDLCGRSYVLVRRGNRESYGL